MAQNERMPALGYSTDGWHHVGETSNTVYFASEKDVLMIVPRVDAVDDEQTADENVDFQKTYWANNGRSGACVIFFDRLKSQDKGARHVYAKRSTADLQTCAALVGGSALARAMGGFFMGLTRPTIPTRMFADLDTALDWTREMNAEYGKARTP